MRPPLSIVVAFMALVGGCAHVRTSERIDDHELRSYEESTVGGDWTYAGSLVVGEGTPVAAEITATRSHRCETVTHRVVHRTRLIDRTPERPGWTWAFGIAGTLGAAGLSTGIALDATGTAPFTSQQLRIPGMPMYGTDTRLEAPLYLTVIGAALVPFLLVALGEGIRSTGGSEDMGEEDITNHLVSDCETEPASGVAVRVTSGDEILGEGVTDGDGIARLTITEPTIAEAELHLSIEDDPVEGVEALRERLVALRRARDAAAEAEEVARQRADRLAALDQEIADGRCSDETHAALERVFQRAVTIAHLLSSGSSTEIWDLVTHSFEVVDPGGEDFIVRPGLRGEHHLVVVAMEPPHVQLLDGHGYAVTEVSGYGDLGTNDAHTVTRVIRSSTGERLTARISGRGCTLVMLFSVFR